MRHPFVVSMQERGPTRTKRQNHHAEWSQFPDDGSVETEDDSFDLDANLKSKQGPDTMASLDISARNDKLQQAQNLLSSTK
jgi:hypothetical protein